MNKYTLLKNKTTGARSIYRADTHEKITEADRPEEYARLRKLAVVNLNKANARKRAEEKQNVIRTHKLHDTMQGRHNGQNRMLPV